MARSETSVGLEDEKKRHYSAYDKTSFAHERKNVNSDRNRNSSTDSSKRPRSASLSISVSTSVSLSRQEEDEAASSSSSTEFDSSSSASTSVSSPQHQFFVKSSKGGSEGSDRKSYKHQTEEKESQSTKLRRILYGSSSSSYTDEYVNTSSSSSGSAGSFEFNNEDAKIEHGHISRKRDNANSGAVIIAGNESARAAVNENLETIQDTINVKTSLNRERYVPTSLSSGKVSVGDDKNVKYGESFANQGRTSNHKFEGKASDGFNDYSEVQLKGSESYRKNEKGKDILNRNNTTIAASTTSTDFSIYSRGLSLTKPKLSTSNNSRSSSSSPNISQGSSSKSSRMVTSPSENLEESRRSSRNSKISHIRPTSVRKLVVGSKKGKGDDTTQESANSATPTARFYETFDVSTRLDSTDLNSSDKSRNEVERKESAMWARTEKFKERSFRLNDSESDELDWKPPALTTFSRSNYSTLTKQNTNKMYPKTPESAFGFKQGSRSTRKMAKNNIPPPISEIIVIPSADDDSTLGTEGTYLERFPKNKRNKNKAKLTVNGTSSTNDVARTTGWVVKNAKPTKNFSGDTEKNDLAVQIMTVECKDKFPEIIEENVPDEPKSSPQQRPEFARLGTNNYKFTTSKVSGIGGDNMNYILGRTDPPGDAYLFSYDPDLHKSQSLFGLTESTRTDDSDYVDEDYIESTASSVGNYMTSSHETQQHLRLSPKPVTSWVPSGMKGRSEALDLDPTRIFINSLMIKKRLMSSPGLKVDGRLLQQKTQTYQDSQTSVAIERNGVPERTNSEFSMKQKNEMRITNISESKSKNARVHKETPRSEYSTPQSCSISILDSSDISMDKRLEISRAKGSPSASQSQTFPQQGQQRGSGPTIAEPLQKYSNSRRVQSRRVRSDGVVVSIDTGQKDAHFRREPEQKDAAILNRVNDRDELSQAMIANYTDYSEKPNYLFHEKKSRRKPQSIDTSGLQYMKVQQIQVQSNEGENNKSDNSESPSSLPSSSVSAEHVSDHVDRSFRREKSGKIGIILLLSLGALIIASAIVLIVLWQLDMLFNGIDDDSQYIPTTLPTLKLPITLSPLTKAPSIAPAEIESANNLFDLIIEAYPQGQSALEDPNSPQAQALKWLESSKKSGVAGLQSLLQRYALATLYYSTNGKNWNNNTGWLSEDDGCLWMSKSQSICDEMGEYIKLDLEGNNLVGTLPPELGILSGTLRSINIRRNFLYGEIPSAMIADLANLEVLDLSSNSFSGVLTKQLFDATSLTRLSLFENQISSSIPTELGQLTKLDVLDLGSNMLTSTIPPTIEKLSKLAGLSLFNNTLTGTIPTELSDIQSLKMLYIDSNNLEAPLPTELCRLNISDFWGDCEKIQCTCCTMCCSNNFGCFPV